MTNEHVERNLDEPGLPPEGERKRPHWIRRYLWCLIPLILVLALIIPVRWRYERANESGEKLHSALTEELKASIDVRLTEHRSAAKAREIFLILRRYYKGEPEADENTNITSGLDSKVGTDSFVIPDGFDDQLFLSNLGYGTTCVLQIDNLVVTLSDVGTKAGHTREDMIAFARFVRSKIEEGTYVKTSPQLLYDYLLKDTDLGRTLRDGVRKIF